MAMVWRRLADWKVWAVGFELAVAGACVFVGYQVVHDRQLAPAVKITGAVVAPAPVPVSPVLASPASSTVPAARPGLADILQHINRDDARLYWGQWATIQVLGSGTRDYLERHIVPMLLTAARGGSK